MSRLATFDTRNHDAFAHWVFESAIFLPSVPRASRIVLSARKEYKRLFCNYFGFSDKDIDYDGVPRTDMITLMNNPVPAGYPSMLKSFASHFRSSVLPSVEYIVMPRQTRENCVPNDRPCPITPHLNAFKNSYTIVNTDKIDSLQTQIDLVNSGRTLFVVDGSAALVNGMFCSGKKIYIVRTGEGAIEIQARIYPMMKLLLDHVCSRNTVSFIHGHEIGARIVGANT